MAEISRLENLKQSADRLTKKYGPDNPFVKDLREQIAKLSSSPSETPQETYWGGMRSVSKERVETGQGTRASSMKGTLTILRSSGREPEITEYTDRIPLADLQRVVGGFIEVIEEFDRLHGAPCVVFANEDGRLLKLPVNRRATELWAQQTGSVVPELLGDVAVVTGDSEFMAAL